MNPTPLPARPGRPAAVADPGRNRSLIILALAAVVVVLLFVTCSHRENRYEKLATSVTQAIQNNDMTPVAKDFNAITREKFTRSSVGRNSDLLNKYGKLKTVKETTPAGAARDTHQFRAEFDHGSVAETMVLDPDGKIVSFRFTPTVPLQ